MTWFCGTAPDVRVRDGLVHIAIRIDAFDGELKEVCTFVMPLSKSILFTQGLIAAIEEHEQRSVNVIAFEKPGSTGRIREPSSE